MSALRPPQHLAEPPHIGSGEGRLRFELLEEIDAGLRRCEERVADCVAALHAHDADGGDAEGRRALVDEAADAVWALLVQHECCDCIDHDALVARYAIPPEVMVRVGAQPH